VEQKAQKVEQREQERRPVAQALPAGRSLAPFFLFHLVLVPPVLVPLLDAKKSGKNPALF